MFSNLFFFFSSRRRHTRYIGDWSSDVCSSDLSPRRDIGRSRPRHFERGRRYRPSGRRCCKAHRSEERRVGKSVDLGGWRSIKKKKKERENQREEHTE